MSVCVLHFSKNQNWNSKSVTFLQKKKQNEIFAKKNWKLEIGNRKSGSKFWMLTANCWLLTLSLQSITCPISPVIFFCIWKINMSPPGAHFKKEPLGDSFDVQVLKPQGLVFFAGDIANIESSCRLKFKKIFFLLLKTHTPLLFLLREWFRVSKDTYLRCSSLSCSVTFSGRKLFWCLFVSWIQGCFLMNEHLWIKR